MSSSRPDAAARRFLLAFVAGILGTAALLAAALLTVDPLGVTDGNGLCPAGAKTTAARPVKPLVAERQRPRTIVLGTSRVQFGFSEMALATLGSAPSVNLGIETGVPSDFASLAEEALAGGRLQRAYIGVDFNTAFSTVEEDFMSPIAVARFPGLERARRGLASYGALTGLVPAMVDCRTAFNADGSAVLETFRRAETFIPADREGVELTREIEARGALLRHATDQPRFRTRLAQLRALIARLRAHDVEVVLFSAPYREELLEIYDRAGLLGEFERFHTELARLANEEGASFVDLHGEPALAELRLPACAEGGIGCHYLDLTHYGPLVGERIAERLAHHP